MGTYNVNCLGCEKMFPLFSGSNEQFCEECKNPKGTIMNSENKEVEYLNQIIKLQQDVIDMLKVEIGRLKITTIQSPLHNPGLFVGPGNSVNPNPFVPYPHDPLNPFVVTCGDPTPPGSRNSYSNSGLSTESLDKINGLIKALELSNYTGKP